MKKANDENLSPAAQAPPGKKEAEALSRAQSQRPAPPHRNPSPTKVFEETALQQKREARALPLPSAAHPTSVPKLGRESGSHPFPISEKTPESEKSCSNLKLPFEEEEGQEEVKRDNILEIKKLQEHEKLEELEKKPTIKEKVIEELADEEIFSEEDCEIELSGGIIQASQTYISAPPLKGANQPVKVINVWLRFPFLSQKVK